jgi:hypothetical protein
VRRVPHESTQRPQPASPRRNVARKLKLLFPRNWQPPTTIRQDAVNACCQILVKRRFVELFMNSFWGRLRVEVGKRWSGPACGGVEDNGTRAKKLPEAASLRLNQLMRARPRSDFTKAVLPRLMLRLSAICSSCWFEVAREAQRRVESTTRSPSGTRPLI